MKDTDVKELQRLSSLNRKLTYLENLSFNNLWERWCTYNET